MNIREHASKDDLHLGNSSQINDEISFNISVFDAMPWYTLNIINKFLLSF